MQRRIEALKLDTTNEDEISSKSSKIEEECVSINLIINNNIS